MNQIAAIPSSENIELHLQILHRKFHESAADQCLLWVNPAQNDLFEENPLVETRKVRVPISHPRFDLQFAPYLVPLDLSKSADAEIFKASVQAAWESWELISLQAYRGQPIAGWIITHETPKALAQYWAKNCYLHKRSELTKLLRFHDPSVREWLWPMLSKSQQLQLLGPAQTIIALNRQQGLMQHDVVQTENINQRIANKPESQNLALFSAQWAQIDDFATVHAAWLSHCAMCPDYRATHEQQGTWVQSILVALEQATKYGILDTQDRQLFALHALQLGSIFHMHQKLQPVWMKTKEGDFYGGAIEEIFNVPVGKLSTYLQNI